MKNKRKKLKQVIKKSAQEKAREMFGALRVNEEIGNSAVRELTIRMKNTQLPMGGLADRAVEYFKDKMDDEHIGILFAVFSLIFSRILFDPSIGCITMDKMKKGDKNNDKGDTGKTGGRIIIP